MLRTYPGNQALSSFRKQKLLADIKRLAPAVKNLEARFIHFVASEKLSASAEARLLELLSYGKPLINKPKGELFLAVPRPGTISPWSSKATDITHNCGLKDVRRVERGTAYYIDSPKPLVRQAVTALLHDRMTETLLDDFDKAAVLFEQHQPQPMKIIKLAELERANTDMGLALSAEEIDYLRQSYKELGRDPTDAELLAFGQINSEHARHKIFNAEWIVDGKPESKSLFAMIKNTYRSSDKSILSAYSDNAAILKGSVAKRFFAQPDSQIYAGHEESIHMDIKAETHNHPTAIAPLPGAATGTGGEIRDEAAAGQGGKPKVGLAGYTVSNLNLPDAARPWEKGSDKPDFMASALDIMIEAPLGASGYGNEYGRPTTLGYFRTYEQAIEDQLWGYHKPIMIAGGIGNVRDEHIHKKKVPAGALVIQIGGPAMLIGLGGAAGSSMQSGQSSAELDFASVQRANAELQRRTQEVIDYCWSLGPNNPILSIHDVGGGGLATALSEIVHDAGLGAEFELRDVPNAEPSMSPAEIWCNESQERYVIAIDAKDLAEFEKICQREKCPFAVVGKTTTQKQLILNDSHFGNKPIDLPMDILLGRPPRTIRQFKNHARKPKSFVSQPIKFDEAVKRVLQLPAVASKKFLITIGDRTVGGLVVRDQMVGPWQVPVSNLSVTATSFDGLAGEAMAIGERPPIALIDPAASARMAVGEALTNIAAAAIDKISDVKLSANWMAAAGHGNEDQSLFQGVKALGEEFCPALGITIPVGKDSLSMRTLWKEDGQTKSVTSPLSVVISAFAPLDNTSLTLTPQLQADPDSSLILIDLGEGKNRLGGSALAQVYNQIGAEPPDIEPEKLKSFFSAIQSLNKEGKILAYHDRSDGGLLSTLAEMMFASRLGVDAEIGKLPGLPLEVLFSEELGAVIQVKNKDKKALTWQLQKQFGMQVYDLGIVSPKQELRIMSGESLVYKNSRVQLEKWWADTSYRIQALRDDPGSAKQEFDAIADDADPGLSAKIPFKLAPKRHDQKPKVAIFREQGVNGHVEMAAAFDKAGFTSIDLHLSDLKNNRKSFDEFAGLAACGGFSYGDVLGAGEGWAKSILFSKDLRAQFEEFFNRPDSFTLGVCNGCQMLSALKEIIPGAQKWPRFLKNSSEQFEARLVLTKINDSPSILFRGMSDWKLPIPVAHGEGRAEFDSPDAAKKSLKSKLAPLQFIDNYGKVSENYPSNPNGSPLGITALTTSDGRATIMMPHPERSFLTKQLSWHPKDWPDTSPWFQIFLNARQWVG